MPDGCLPTASGDRFHAAPPPQPPGDHVATPVGVAGDGRRGRACRCGPHRAARPRAAGRRRPPITAAPGTASRRPPSTRSRPTASTPTTHLTPLPAAPAHTVPRRSPLACTLALLLSSPAFAAPAPAPDAGPVDFDTMVVTAAGFEQKITDAPASISVITREELTTRPYITLIDAVRDLEGVDVGETSDKTGQKTISMRGMGA